MYMENKGKITGKKYSLVNSYYKNKREHYPDTLLEIVQYWKAYGELPFEHGGGNWVYDAVCERQKYHGIRNGQYMTPETTAKNMACLADNFIPGDLKVLNACSGIGQIARCLIESGLDVTGFDSDPEMVEVCRILYPKAVFEKKSYKDWTNEEKWDLVVSNPPHGQRDLLEFTGWLTNVLGPEGKAILLVPQDYYKKDKPKELAGYLDKLTILHHERVKESFAHTSHMGELVIVGLSRAWQNEIKENSQQPLKKEPLMEHEDLKKVQMVSLDKITVNPLNPRKRIKEGEIEELAGGIKKIGLLQPITLRRKGGALEIVAGERRYRAFLHNKESYIPAVVRDLSDARAMEMALAENINRSDLSPIEEAGAYRHFLETYHYKIEDLTAKFGKSENYIRGRLRLLSLIGEFRLMLEEGEIPAGMGLELSKYTEPVQKEVLREHFSREGGMNNWKELGTKDFAARMQKLYSMNLADYPFDKTECKACPYNTDTCDLFEQFKGKCTNIGCLQKKKNDYTLEFCKSYKGKGVSEICISPYDKVNPEINQKLKEEGLAVKTTPKMEILPPPQKPDPCGYKMKFQYEEAMEKYKKEETEYLADLAYFEEETAKGEYKKCVYIGSGEPVACYVPVDKAKEANPKEALLEEDRKNRESTLRNIYRDSLGLLSEKEIGVSVFTEFEEDLFWFLLLDFLDKRYYKLFGIKDNRVNMLSDKEKDRIIKNLTLEQRAVLKRAFIAQRFSTRKVADGTSKKMLLLPEFMKLHFPGDVAAIVNKYMAPYNKARQVIEERIRKLEGRPDMVVG